MRSTEQTIIRSYLTRPRFSPDRLDVGGEIYGGSAGGQSVNGWEGPNFDRLYHKLKVLLYIVIDPTLQFGTQVKFRWSSDCYNWTADNTFSAPWYFSEMELEPAAG